jgi:hypothetical protein
MIWLLLLAWLPVTYFLHVFIHEGAHWLVFKAFGRNPRLHLLPERINGTLYFGRVTWIGEPLTSAQMAAALAAPVVAELAWIALALGVSVFWPWAALEAASGLVDLVVWLCGRKPLTDKQRVLEYLR